MRKPNKSMTFGIYTRVSEKVQTAYTPHRCDECIMWIEPNTRYRRTAIKHRITDSHSATVFTHKSHLNHPPVILPYTESE